MGVDTTKASDHPTTNALAQYQNENVDVGGAYIGFRATNIKLEDPPEIDDSLLLMVKVQCVGDGRKKMADGEMRDTRALKVIAAWKPGKTPAGQDPNQPGLYEIDPVNDAPAGGSGEDADDSEDGEA